MVYGLIWAGRQIDRWPDGQADRQTARQTGRQTDRHRQTAGQTGRHVVSQWPVDLSALGSFSLIVMATASNRDPTKIPFSCNFI